MLDQVWIEYRDQLRSVIRNIIPDPSAVDDLLQEVFLKALRTGRQFETPHDALSFLSRIAINATIDQYRCHRRRKRYWRMRPSDPTIQEVADERVRDHPLNRLLYRERHQLRQELLEEIDRAVRRLPARQREAIRLVFGDRNRPLKEVCSERGVPYSTVRSRMLRGVDGIRKHLRKRGLLSHDD